MSIVRSGVSYIGSHRIYDKELYRYLGPETYCRLQRQDPDLYLEFIECSRISKAFSEAEAIVSNYGEEPRSLKHKIVETYGGVSEEAVVYDLARERQPEIFDFEHTSGSTFWWVLWLIVIVFITVLYLFSAGLINSIKNNTCLFQPPRYFPIYEIVLE